MRRRQFLQVIGGASLASIFPPQLAAKPETVVNDIHTGLNPTSVESVVRVRSLAHVQEIVSRCRDKRKFISISASRHAGGAQQFGTGTVLLDMRSLNRMLGFDREKGILKMKARRSMARVNKKLSGG